MSVQVRIRRVKLTEAIRLYVDRKLKASLRRFAGRLGDVQITLTDMNGPRGGVDKSCRIAAGLLLSGGLVVREAEDANLFAAIRKAIEGIERALRGHFMSGRRRRLTRRWLREERFKNQHEAGETGLLPLGEPVGEMP